MLKIWGYYTFFMWGKWFVHAFQTHCQIIKRIRIIEFLHNHNKNFVNVHYQLRGPFQFKKSSKKKPCVVSARVVWNNIKLIREWSELQEINNKFTYGVLPEHMDTLPTLVTIDTQIIHGFIFRAHLLCTYEIRYMLKRSITFLKELCGLPIEKYVRKRFRQLAKFHRSLAAKVAECCKLLKKLSCKINDSKHCIQINYNFGILVCTEIVACLSLWVLNASENFSQRETACCKYYNISAESYYRMV